MATVTKKITQLQPITDAELTSEAILPVVVSDPLSPNRQAKTSQVLRCASAGSKAAPGIAFSLNRSTGLYQSAANELGVAFGPAGLLYQRSVSGTDATITCSLLDDNAPNASLRIVPKAGGFVSVGGEFRVTDTNLVVTNALDSNKKIKFDLNSIVSGVTGPTSGRTVAFPLIQGSTLTLVGTDTIQTLTNKQINIGESDLVILDGDDVNKRASFGLNWSATPLSTRTYFLPDPGQAFTSVELVDSLATQNLSNKTLIGTTFQDTTTSTGKVIISCSGVSSPRTVTFPNSDITVVGASNAQNISNKNYLSPTFADTTDVTKKITFSLTNQTPGNNYNFAFPAASLNVIGVPSLVVTEKATQVLYNKSIDNAKFVDSVDSARVINLDLSNITTTRTIKFPDGDATLLSTDNTAVEGIAFGGALSAASFGGRLRLQSHFLAGW